LLVPVPHRPAAATFPFGWRVTPRASAPLPVTFHESGPSSMNGSAVTLGEGPTQQRAPRLESVRESGLSRRGLDHHDVPHSQLLIHGGKSSLRGGRPSEARQACTVMIGRAGSERNRTRGGGGEGIRTPVLERPPGSSTGVACDQISPRGSHRRGPLGQPSFGFRLRPPGGAAAVSLLGDVPPRATGEPGRTAT
jgi:hypothetical protein